MINAQGALAVPRSRVGICYVTCRFKHARCVLLSLGPFHVTRDGDEAHVPSALDIEQEQLLRVGDREEGPVGVHTQGLVPGQSVLPLVQVDAVLLVPGKVVNFNKATGFHICKIIKTRLLKTKLRRITRPRLAIRKIFDIRPLFGVE